MVVEVDSRISELDEGRYQIWLGGLGITPSAKSHSQPLGAIYYHKHHLLCDGHYQVLLDFEYIGN